MAEADRRRWDERYAAQGPPPVSAVDPPDLLTRHANEFPAAGLALDLACGQGFGAVWLARRGLDVRGFDVSAVAIDRAREVASQPGNVTKMERRVLEAIIYEREPPIARIILNRVDKANTKDAVLVTEVDNCLHEADRDKEIKVVILKANGNGFCGGHVARWGPDENPYPDFGNTFEELYKGTADLFLWPTLYLWEFPKPTISQIHGYCMGGGIYLGLLTDFCVASEDAYFQMPLAQSLGEPGGHTMIEPWLLMNWHRTMDWLLLAPTLSAQQALDWGLLNRVVPREELEDTVEEMARKIAQIPLTTLMAVKNNVKRAWELMGMRVHLQVSHILTNMVGAASDVQARRAELIQSGMKPRDFVDQSDLPPA
ncbi:enoyl-CoA hydratase-related protein [Mycobacterium interjectum]|uniref:enoyl-CoA hydratase-related protein n=2 Tax=Mycobacterium interjectum TaxID=33895 RepID=UPI001155F39D|nr:enoyl-CoA hydratase-related protein [Mycobacterium interjectum]